MSSKLNRQNCIFCRIADGDEEAKVLYDEAHVVVFQDTRPLGPIHLLAIPKMHIKNCNELTFQDIKLLDNLYEGGFRALQRLPDQKIEQIYGFHKPPHNSVDHLHMHVISFDERGDVDYERVFGNDGSWWFAYDEIRDKLSAENEAMPRNNTELRKSMDKKQKLSSIRSVRKSTDKKRRRKPESVLKFIKMKLTKLIKFIESNEKKL